MTIAGNAADTTSVEQFANFNTVIMNTHGNLDPAGRFYIVSGQPSTYDKDYWRAIGFPVPLGTACFRLLRPVVPEADPPRCYISMYDNYLGWTVSPNTIVYGGFCDGFNGTVPGNTLTADTFRLGPKHSLRGRGSLLRDRVTRLWDTTSRSPSRRTIRAAGRYSITCSLPIPTY